MSWSCFSEVDEPLGAVRGVWRAAPWRGWRFVAFPETAGRLGVSYLKSFEELVSNMASQYVGS